MSNTLWPHGLQHTRLPCPLPIPRAYSNLCPSSQWCHPTISSSVIPFSSHFQSFPASGSFQMNESALCIRWPKYWSFSFSISLSNEHPGLILGEGKLQPHQHFPVLLCLSFWPPGLAYILGSEHIHICHQQKMGLGIIRNKKNRT